MNAALICCLLAPLMGMVAIALFGRREQAIARISFWATHAMGLGIAVLLGLWAANGFRPHEYHWFTIYQQQHYHLPALFYLDRISAVYLLALWLVFSVIVRYCRHYLHRESGYKRFFITIFGFAFGLNLVVLSGSIDMLFAGWEIVGIASFLLIAFYRHRAQPVRNALRAYTVYRFCDVGLLLGAWMGHGLFHESDHFSQLASLFAQTAPPPASQAALALMSLLIFIAAAGKSAQFPFCFWLPRAMEGPTPSSAIFYGALSVHLGVFLLLRTTPIWAYHALTRWLLFAIGLVTVVIASLSARTQANIKGQVAYASITQVGLMFMELALGLHTLVLAHFLGNAFLRCYQLLVSPSIVAHLLRVEGAIDSPLAATSQRPSRLPPPLAAWARRLDNTVKVFALQEGNLDLLVKALLWTPLKRAGAAINRHPRAWLAAAVAVAAAAAYLVADGRLSQAGLSLLAAMAMMLVSLSAFSQKSSASRLWNAVTLSCALAAVAVLCLHPGAWADVALYASGIVPSWLLGLWVLAKLPPPHGHHALPFAYLALADRRPGLALAFFLSFLGLVGFPVTPAFIGEDLLLYHASGGQGWVAALIALSFVVNGIAAARLYLRVCMGSVWQLTY